MKLFHISKEVTEGVVASEEGVRIGFDRDHQTIRLLAYSRDTDVKFTEIKDYVETLNALVFALREDINEAIEEEQDDSLPDIVGDDTDHIG